MRIGIALPLVALLAFGGGCSDDSTPPKDSGPKDSAADGAVKDTGGGKEAGTDTVKPDGTTADGTVADGAAATGTVKGTISRDDTKVTCGTTAKDDCKGTFAIAAFAADDPTSKIGAFVAVTGGDVSGTNTTQYEMKGVPVGDWYIGGTLVEDGPPPPGPGDISSGPPFVKVTVTKDGTVTADFKVVFRIPAPQPDGGVSDGGAG